MGQDGASVGLFQQQTQDGWGTVAEESNPADATGMFVQRLLSISDWQLKKPWRVAEEVQGSRFAHGSNYKDHWLEVGVVLAHVTGSFTIAGCGAGSTGGVGGATNSYGLTRWLCDPTWHHPLGEPCNHLCACKAWRSLRVGSCGPGCL